MTDTALVDWCQTNNLLNQAMLMLAAQPRSLFVGQGVEYGGVATYRHLDGVLASQRIEWPVAEELQLGACIGLALQGYLPVCIFPRIDFMLRAMDQLCNHLDKLKVMSQGQYDPKVIMRTRVGSKKPLDAGPQHTNNHSYAIKHMLTNVDMVALHKPSSILEVYQKALESERSTIVVERFDG